MRNRLFSYAMITAAVMTALFFGACNVPEPATEPERIIVAVVDGHIVEPFEYFVYLSEQQQFFEATAGPDIWYAAFGATDAQTQAKLNALRQLALVRTTANQARLIGLEQSEISVEIARANTEAHLALLPPGLAESTASVFENIFEVMLERQLFEDMYKEVTRNFTVSQADFEVFFENYVLRNPNAVQTKATVAAVARIEPSPTAQAMAHTLRQALENHTEADHANHSLVTISTIYDLTNSDLPAGVIEATRNLDPSHVSPILQTIDKYYIIRIEARQIVAAATLVNSAMEEYTKLMRNEIFNQAYQTWRESEPEIRINREVFDTISISDLRN
ncbi:MAG: hypothetical protein FWE92_00575 [Defluviitaleaceae bacterium]|nr:hypothetical protein [Defluviitaleaceae bacterium]